MSRATEAVSLTVARVMAIRAQGQQSEAERQKGRNRERRKAFDAVRYGADFEGMFQQFIGDFGQDGWDREVTLALRREAS